MMNQDDLKQLVARREALQDACDRLDSALNQERLLLAERLESLLATKTGPARDELDQCVGDLMKTQPHLAIPTLQQAIQQLEAA